MPVVTAMRNGRRLSIADEFAELGHVEAAAYSRASLDAAGDGASTGGQGGTAKDVAVRCDWNLPPERNRVDNSIGASKWSRGKGQDRPDWDRTVADVEHNRVHVVIFRDTSRAARNDDWHTFVDL